MLHREVVGLPPSIYPVDEWALVETEFSRRYLDQTETMFSLANGYLGVRGCVDEGRPYVDRGTYINGFHETWPIAHAEEAYGFARTGQTMVPVPDARRFHLYVDDEPLFLPTADLRRYERRLEFRTGILSRELDWLTPAGKRVRVRSQRLVSLAHRHLVGIRYEITMLEGTAPVVVSSQLRHEVERWREENLDPRQTRDLGDVLRPVDQTAEGTRAVLEYAVASSGMTLACAIDHVVTSSQPMSRSSEVDPRRGKLVLSLRAEPGTTVTIEKFAAYHTSRSVSPRQLADRCHRTLDRAVDGGFDEIAREQRDYLDGVWHRGDVRIGGNPVVQQAVRWNLFQLVQATARSEGTGVPAKGLTGSGYEGHYFWDAEVYVLPYLTYTEPRVARNLLRFRHSLLGHARRRARELSQRGALFPWRTINGEEASAYYEAGTAQYHINADIVHALRQYVEVSGDDEFLRESGAELLVETARLWVDLGFFRNGADESFHIFGVTGPDEYTTLVNDNAYTNLMARENLAYAADTVAWLRDDHPDDYAVLVRRTGVDDDEVVTWRRAADAMYIPYDADLGITPQDQNFLQKELWDFAATPRDRYPLLLHFHPLVIYRFQVLKQADIVLAMFLLPSAFTREQKRRNFDYYDPLTTGDSSLSAAIQAIIAAELGQQSKALVYFRYGLFTDLADVAGNTSHGVHIAAAGGVWMTLVNGFAGMRRIGDELAFDPWLPAGWEELAFAVQVRGQRICVEIGRFEAAYMLEGTKPVTIRHQRDPVTLEPGQREVCTIEARRAVPPLPR